MTKSHIPTKLWKLWILPLTILLALILATSVLAAPLDPSGDPDSTFDGDGRVTVNISGGRDELQAVALQGDGKMVMVGFSQIGAAFDFAIARLNTNGTLDTTFAGDGTLNIGVGSQSDVANAVVIQPNDQKIIVVGDSYGASTPHFTVMRLNTNGTPDTSFSGDGIATVSFGVNGNQANAVALQPDGKIVVGGSVSDLPPNWDYGLARFNADGSLDTTFDGDGKVRIDLKPAGSGNQSYDQINAIVIQPDGKIVVGGESCCEPHFQFALSRFNANGSLDTTFGTNGNVILRMSHENNVYPGDEIRGLLLMPDGRIIAGGKALGNPLTHPQGSGLNTFALARFNTNGTLDTSFDGDGKIQVYLGNNNQDEITGIAFQSDDKIVAFGTSYSFTTGSTDFGMARFNWDDGSLDTTFGTNGVVTSNFGGHEYVAAGMVLPGGKPVAFGTSGPFDNNDFTAARYQSDPPPTTPGTPDLIAANDSGPSSTDNKTTNRTPSFTGTCTTGETVILKLNGSDTTPRSRIRCVNSAYSFNILTSMADGTYSFTAVAVNGAGTSSASAPLSLVIDNVAPTANPTSSPAANAQGWNKSDVTVTWNWSDGSGSGPASCAISTTTSGEGAALTLSSTCQDFAGNSNSSSRTFKVDKTKPLITGSRSPAANANGWNNANVTVSFSCAENVGGSGLASNTVGGGGTISSEGANQAISNTGACTDIAGNTADTATVSVSIDKTKPIISGSLSPAANAAGWNNSNTTVNFTCADNAGGSGIDSSNVAGATLTSEGANQSVTNTGTCTDKAGNTANTGITVSGINIDKTKPTITGSRSPAANANGWNNANVTASFTCADNAGGSGLATNTVTGATLSTEGANQSVTNTGACTDKAGNTANAATVSAISIDKTKPTITGSRSPAANANGWNNANVTVSFACADNISGSGLATNTVAGGTTLSSEGANQSVTNTGACTDKAGNSADAATVSASIDKTKPTITGSRSPAANANGWNNTNVTVSFACADNAGGSDLATNTVMGGTLGIEGANQSVTNSGTCTDKAGNIANAASVTGISIDKTKPTITGSGSPAANANGWNNANVIVGFACADNVGGSGLVSNSVGGGTTLTSEGANQTVTNTGTCTDKAGNSANAVTFSASIDKTKPIISGSRSPAANADGWNNANVTASFTCADNAGGSGLATNTVLGATVSTEGANQSVTNTGACTDKAGNSASAATVSSISIDKTKPTITGSRSPAANGNGWNNVNVIASFTCADNAGGSGLSTNTVAGATVSAEGANQSVTNTGSCVDKAGNSANAATVSSISIDKTKPTITGSRSPAANATGWNNANVTASFTCADNISGSGLATNSVVGATLSGEGANQSVTNTGVCTDKAGNSANAATVGSINIDKTAPDTSISNYPGHPTANTNALFEFSGSDSLSLVANVQCKLDTSAFADCTTPKSYSALVNGSHNFQARATDQAGNTDSTPASFTWTIDTTPPDTLIDTKPAHPSNSSSATFTFHGTDGTGTGAAVYHCKLDSGLFISCTSGQSYSSLTEGSHTFAVRALDGAFNTDGSPASFTWTVDTTPPNTSISSNPLLYTSSTDAAFGFSGTDSATGIAGYTCSLDGAPFTSCTSVKNYSALANGSHTFKVQATDGASNVDTSPASFAWEINTDAPAVTINQAAGQTDPSQGDLHFTVIFAKPVSGFTGDDVTLGGDAGATTATVNEIGPNDGTTYEVVVSGMTQDGMVTASLAARVASDSGGNGNLASTSTDNRITYILSLRPVAGDDDADAVEDGILHITLASLLVNDTDDNGDPLSVTGVSNPAHGTAVISDNGTPADPSDDEVVYTPAADFNGDDSFDYTIDDGNGGTDTGTVNLTVDPVNDAPVATDDDGETVEAIAVIVKVLANDHDNTDGGTLDPSSVSVTTDPASGTTSVNPANGEITYTPNDDFSGTDSFTYEVCDNGIPLPALCRSATVNLTIVVDTDDDGTGDDVDTDDDGDGVEDGDDAFPLDPTETVDTDGDGTGNNADTDDDDDGVDDAHDAFPLDPTESVDTDSDGTGNNADTDDDGDGVEDGDDAFPLDPSESVDTDSDGIGNNADKDDDGDGVDDDQDAFPLDPSESIDTDGDGIGNNADTDDDGDHVADVDDAFPLDPTESIDTDTDGTGNNADTDDDGDGVEDGDDAFPLDPTESVDTDGDGTGNNADTDDDGDGVEDADDAFPLDPTESVDTDTDGTGNNADKDDDGDGVDDDKDAFPLDPSESVDTDGDGTGNNADTDDDGDGVDDGDDAFPLDPTETIDTDTDGTGNNADTDDDGDSVLDGGDNCPLLGNPDQANHDADTLGDTCDTDDDNDSQPDSADNCVLAANPGQEDIDGDKQGDACDPDDDGDGEDDNADNCPLVSNPDQANADGDERGDACDDENDGDGIDDADDNCPAVPNPSQTDTDKDGQGDACDTDDDGDSINDSAPDNCPLVANLDQSNTDGDGQGDACDPDDDEDGVVDGSDNCPLVINAGQTDSDGNGVGDSCDDDVDGDKVKNADDNCRVNANPDQLDSDKDGQGNLCDTDDDNDGVNDGADAFPLDPSESIDTDKDGTGDNADTDDDGDGVADDSDAFPLDPTESVDTDGDGTGNNADKDDDGDGVDDDKDAFPLDPNEHADTDGDGVGDNGDNCPVNANPGQVDSDGNGKGDACDPLPSGTKDDADGDSVADVDDNCPAVANAGQENADGDKQGDACDTDDDNDGVADGDDAFPLDPDESVDTDGDGIGNNADGDDDGDGVVDGSDAFPLDPDESVDTDNDGTGNNADTDDDGDGVKDEDDAFPLDPTESVDTDGDGTGNNADTDDDGDGVKDDKDAFPLDPTESVDTDGDGTGNNADKDDDGDGVEDADDAFPLDPSESVDTDGDGIGNNADTDDDNDGVKDGDDAFPLDPTESVDTDGDGIGNNADPDDDGDGVADDKDAFPLDPSESVDTDGDGTGNNADKDDDGDGVDDDKDAFPLDPSESVDTDGDGIGNNADPDNDGDGVADGDDAFPLDPTESVDTDGDGIGNNADTDDDGDGVEDAQPDNCPLISNPDQANHDTDTLGDACDPDDDNDGQPDSGDNCTLVANPGQEDKDADGQGDACDDDDEEDGDGDGQGDSVDNCPADPNPTQTDTDGDGQGDACDSDDDGDGVDDSAPDNCPLLGNPDQLDSDKDGQGDLCDPDDDNDGVADGDDAFPLDPTEQSDGDGDGIGDNSDNCPAVANADQADADGDAVGDVCDTPEEPEPIHPKLTLVKSAAPTTYQAVGDAINYSYKLTNDGDVTLSAPITVSDDKTSVTCPAEPTSLAVGESITCTATYVITQADLTAGSVTNIAQAKAKDPANADVTSNQDEETVTRVAVPGTVAGKVWFDANQNGLRDENELPRAGIKVDLYKEDGTFVTTQTSDEDGRYSFGELAEGAYYVEFTEPSGFSFTRYDVGDNESDMVDSDAQAAWLEVSVSDSGIEAKAGESLVYTIFYTNTDATRDATDLVISALVPVGTVYMREASIAEAKATSLVCADGHMSEGSLCALNLPLLPAGASGSATFTVLLHDDELVPDAVSLVVSLSHGSTARTGIVTLGPGTAGFDTIDAGFAHIEATAVTPALPEPTHLPLGEQPDQQQQLFLPKLLASTKN